MHNLSLKNFSTIDSKHWCGFCIHQALYFKGETMGASQNSRKNLHQVARYVR